MIPALPADIPVTVPVLPTIVTNPSVLLHVPPDVPSPKVIVPPGHTSPGDGIVIPAGTGLTFTVAVTVLQLLPREYEITAVPTAPPVTTPEEPTVATDVLPLLQAPPEGVLFNVVVVPWHNKVLPVIAVGTEVTVTVVV